ncbi:17845_t:CDS:1, partial [Funneliformis geosporum]
AKKSVLTGFHSDDLSFLINMLEATHSYNVVSLKDKVEDIIMRSRLINVRNAFKILKHSEKYKAKQLSKYCKEYIQVNKELVREQLIRDSNS